MIIILRCVARKMKYFLQAIDNAKKIVNNHFDEIKKMFSFGGVYEEDEFLSDIMSALTNGEMDLPIGHKADFWKENKNNVPREVFANVNALSFVKNSEYGDIVKKVIDTLRNGGIKYDVTD